MLIIGNRLKAKPKNVLHLGAFIGEESIIYKQMNVDKVVWVEADPATFVVLENVLKDYPEQTAICCAVGKENKNDIDFFVCNNKSCSSLKKLKGHLNRYPNIVETDVISVNMRTADDICTKLNFQPDFINMDLQGGEMEALQGSIQILSNSILKCVYSEVSFEELYAGCSLITDIDDFLAQFGFQRTDLADTGCGWGDAVYERK